MDLNREDREKRARLNRDLGDIGDIIDRINDINRVKDLFSPEDGVDELSWEPEESDEVEELNEPEILDMGDSLAITLEIRQAEREEIELSVDKSSMYVGTVKQDYKRKIGLPSEVLYKGSRATYKNGVLDIVLRKAA